MGVTSQQQNIGGGSSTVTYQISTGTYQQTQSTSSLNGGGSITSHPINLTTLNVNSQMSSSNPSALSSSSLCCLIENGVKCMLHAGNASFSKRIEKQVAQKKLQLVVDPNCSHSYICERHKQIIQSIRTKHQRSNKHRKDGDSQDPNDVITLDDDLSANDCFANGLNNDSSNDMQHNMHTLTTSSSTSKYLSSYSVMPVDFHNLQVATLRKYKRFYRLPVKHGSNKNQLADEVQRHFRTLTVNEKDIIHKFMFMVKNSQNNSRDSEK